MKFYFEASRIVKPKLEALTIAEGELAVANKALAEAQMEMKACQDTLDELQAMFEEKMASKSAIFQHYLLIYHVFLFLYQHLL